ncbi:MAG TPA: DinB family protein [Bacteroidota bacterium]|nr:DinB family protein [Bacteroidota bacterium]
MTEKEMFLSNWQREFGTTMKILKQMPPEKSGFKPPAEKVRTAKELATVFIQELGLVDGVVKGKIEFGPPPSYATYPEVLKGYETRQKEMMEKVERMSESEWNSKITALVGPKKTAEVRKADMLWMVLSDSIHHRGQFSLYLRMVGAKVPSIYGPSADEPWM